MAKRKTNSQITNLTSDRKKPRIALISLRAGGMPHNVGKFLTRAITLLHTSFQLEVCTQSYAPPKSRESQFREFWDFHLGVSGSPRTKWHLSDLIKEPSDVKSSPKEKSDSSMKIKDARAFEHGKKMLRTLCSFFTILTT